MANRGRAVAPLGPDTRSLAGRGNRDDARHGRRRPDGAGARRGSRRRGPDARGGPARRARRSRAGHRHLQQHPRLRRAQRTRSRVAQRRDPSARWRAAGRAAGHVRRGHLARRLHLLPRPARRIRRYAARAQAGRPLGRDRLLDTRSQRLLLDPGVGHPPPGPAASRYETAGGFEGPCELLVAAGTAPT
jgi:hypothetical protein